MPIEQLTDNLGKTHAVDTDSTLGRGGAGVVCRFVSSNLLATHCAKLYEPSVRSPQLRSKVAHMTLNPPKALLGPTYSLAWPTHSLFNRSGVFVGFAMPTAPSGAVQLYEVSTIKLSPKLSATWKKFDRSASGAVILRAKICANLAIAIHWIHESGQYCLGDLKPQNILLSPDGRTCVVDLDSLQISTNSKVVFPAHLVTAEYSPPEARAHKPGQSVPIQWDLFSLAVCIYEVMVGVHPYAATARAQGVAADTLQGKIAQHLFVHGPNSSLLSSIPPPHTLFTNLPSPVQKLFQEAFAIPVRSVARPTAQRWYEILSECIANDSFGAVRMPAPPTSVGKSGVPSRPNPLPTATGTRANHWLSSLGRSKTKVLLGLMILMVVGIVWGYHANERRSERSNVAVHRPETDFEKKSPKHSVSEVEGLKSSPTVSVESAFPNVEPVTGIKVVPTNAQSAHEYNSSSTPSPPNGTPAELATNKYYYKDNNGDGIGGSERILVSIGDKPPPNYTERNGDSWDGEKLGISILKRPSYLRPSSCTGGSENVVSIQVTAHGGRPVPNCTVTLGLATPIEWITYPKLKLGLTGAYEVITGADGAISLHISIPASHSVKPSVTLNFAVNGASPRMFTTAGVTLPVCFSCSPCNSQ